MECGFAGFQSADLIHSINERGNDLMNRRRSIIGIVAVCMIAFGAFSAAGASAEQRAFTCAPESIINGWKDAHCVSKGTGIQPFNKTEITALTKFVTTNAATAANTTAATTSKLKGTISGLETEVQCTELAGEGELTNAAESVSGTGTDKYSGCTVTKPAGRECKVKGGAVTTNVLKATTVGQAENTIKVSPNAGTEFAKVAIEGCLANKPPTAEYPVSGSLIAVVSGATTTTTHTAITTQGTLTFGGNAAGIESAHTLRMAGAGGNPIVLGP
jgi:hypothetical protein